MRIPIREQLGFLVLFSTLLGLAVVTIATWVTNHSFVLDIRSSRLMLTASLKASQISSALALMEYSVNAFSTRVKLQAALEDYINGQASSENLQPAQQDLEAALGRDAEESLTLQAAIFPNSNTGSGAVSALITATGVGLGGSLQLPYTYSNGTPVELGDPGLGYPPNLYPNLTFTNSGGQQLAHLGGQPLYANSSILLGPWPINNTFSLVSITLPVIRNTSKSFILGWMTVVYSTTLLTNVVDSPVGLDRTGMALIIGPSTANNRFAGVAYNQHAPFVANKDLVGEQKVRFEFPPKGSNATLNRHKDYLAGASFKLDSYPAALKALTTDGKAVDGAGSLISTTNEERDKVSVGYAVIISQLCDWVFLLEESQAEVYAPITHLRNILLGCVFGTAGGMLFLIFPIAHFFVQPIRRLRDATKNSIQPPQYDSPTIDDQESPQSEIKDSLADSRGIGGVDGVVVSKSLHLTEKSREVRGEPDEEYISGTFNVPGKVKDGKHWIHDELTDLTQTFNAMSDELMLQYTKLEERVLERTAQLELSKKAAEAANESKTLFIANISHELKTPLNGILGMAAVAMQETEPAKIKHSLGIIMKSGDLLHNLLTDLLTFSRNQVGQHLSLEEKDFRLNDVGSQVRAIFDKQAREGQVDFTIAYEGIFDALGGQEDRTETHYGPPGTGRVKDMHLWGDQHRILQVVINLVGNSLKFTPNGGRVSLTIRCLGESAPKNLTRHGSSDSRSLIKRPIHRLQLLSKGKSDGDSAASFEGRKPGSVDQISGIEPLRPPSHTTLASDWDGGPPQDARELVFEFEVADTGPGIPSHLQSRIFEPFVQGDLRLTKKFGGTGLGLSICQQLAKLMRGSIKMESEVEVGSTFALRVPLRFLHGRRGSTTTSTISITRQSSVSGTGEPGTTKEPNATELPELDGDVLEKTTTFEHQPLEGDSKPRLVGLSQPFFATGKPPMASPGSEIPKKGNKLRVLVAEDNRVNQEVVLRMLRLEEVFDVNVAKDGQEALDKVKESMEDQSPYDLIFMDVQMPNLDGRQSTRKIREIGYSAPIVALTAFSDEINQRECLESGMDYFLAKPIRRPALKHVLKTYCPPIQELDEADAQTSTGNTPPSKNSGKARAQESADPFDAS